MRYHAISPTHTKPKLRPSKRLKPGSMSDWVGLDQIRVGRPKAKSLPDTLRLSILPYRLCAVADIRRAGLSSRIADLAALRLLRGNLNPPRFSQTEMTYRGFKISISTSVFPVPAPYTIHHVGEENSAPVVFGTLLGAFASLDAAFDAAVISARAWIDEQAVALTQRSSF